MKNKKFITKLFIAVLAAVMMIFATTAVCAYDDAECINDPSVQQTAYDYYDDYYDDYYENNSSYRMRTNWGRAIGTSVLVSVIGSVVVVAFVFGRYKFHGRTEPYPYNRKAPLELTGSEDILIDTQIRRERIERDRR